jgi:pseudouridine synthase
MKERIQKVLANAGVASRRNIEQMVLEGRITVNGKVVRDLPILVNPEKDRVTVDTEPVRLAARRAGASGPARSADPLDGERIYVLLNKPKGVYTTNVAQGVQKRAIDLLPEDFPRVYPVGQLDAGSKGLLLLTNDGDLTHKLTHPRFGIPKTYRATVEGFVQPKVLDDLSKGIWMADPRTGKGMKTPPSQVKIVHRERQMTILDITMREGRNRDVRRMLAQLGHKVRDLTRVRMGPLTIDRLTVGKYRLLTGREIRELREFAAMRKGGPRRAGRKADPDALEKE